MRFTGRNGIQLSEPNVIKNLIINLNIAKAIYSINYNSYEMDSKWKTTTNANAAQMTIGLLLFYEVKFG